MRVVILLSLLTTAASFSNRKTYLIVKSSEIKQCNYINQLKSLSAFETKIHATLPVIIAEKLKSGIDFVPTYMKIAVVSIILLRLLTKWIDDKLWTPSRTYNQEENSVGKEYDAWEEEGILEYYWGEHIHLGYYAEKDRARSLLLPANKNFIEAKYDFIDEMLKFGRFDLQSKPASILDVGCGIGGTSRYLAKKFGNVTKVIGITLSDKQQKRATFLAQQQNVPNSEFIVMDALNMKFPDNSFDYVWACESGEHMPDKKKYIEEMTRVLKPGGKIVVATWCQRDEGDKPFTKYENRMLNFLYSEWTHPFFISINDYKKLMEETKLLTDITTDDWTPQTIASWLHSIWVGVFDPWPVFSKPRLWWKTFRDGLTLVRMHKSFDSKLMEYGMMTGTKLKPSFEEYVRLPRSMPVEANQPIVIDNGTGVLKAGFAGVDKPRVVFRSFIGRTKHLRVMPGGSLEGSDVFIGSKAEEHRGALKLSYAMENGIVRNWSDMEKIWSFIYNRDNLNVMSEDHAVLLTEAPLNPFANREKAAEIFFDGLNVPALFCSIQAILSLYASGRTTGVVLDSGDGVTHVVPVYEGFAMPHTIKRMDIAGRSITNYLQILLRRNGRTFHTSSELEVVRQIKENCCVVAFNPSEQEKLIQTSNAYKLPDGSSVDVGINSFRAPEVLFHPELIGSEYRGVHDCLVNSIMQSDIDLRRVLFSQIVLAGGSTMFPGFGDRLLNEIRKHYLSPKDMKIRIAAPPERVFSTWIGGSILASLSTFKSMWISKADYLEHGSRILISKQL